MTPNGRYRVNPYGEAKCHVRLLRVLSWKVTPVENPTPPVSRSIPVVQAEDWAVESHSQRSKDAAFATRFSVEHNSTSNIKMPNGDNVVFMVNAVCILLQAAPHDRASGKVQAWAVRLLNVEDGTVLADSAHLGVAGFELVFWPVVEDVGNPRADPYFADLLEPLFARAFNEGMAVQVRTGPDVWCFSMVRLTLCRVAVQYAFSCIEAARRKVVRYQPTACGCTCVRCRTSMLRTSLLCRYPALHFTGSSCVPSLNTTLRYTLKYLAKH